MTPRGLVLRQVLASTRMTNYSDGPARRVRNLHEGRKIAHSGQRQRNISDQPVLKHFKFKNNALQGLLIA